MNTPDDQRPDERRLRALLHDAVADVHPTDRLAAIKEATMDTDRRKPLVVLGTVVATAAVVSAIAWAGGAFSGGQAPPVAGDPTPTVTDAPTEESPFTARVFYVGDTPLGPRLFSELRDVAADSPIQSAVTTAVETTPHDPDYEGPWPDGVRVESVDLEGAGHDGTIRVRMSENVPTQRPDRMTPLMAELAVQQIVHTAVAATPGEPLRVDFLVGDRRLDQILGVDTSEPTSPADPLEVMSHVQIAEPVEGATASGTLAVSGWSSSFEATAPWQIRSGRDVVLDGSFTAEGWLDDLFPYAGEIDLADLEPGSYTLVVSTDDPTGGEEGPGPTTDTRSFTIE